jgi:hypothetical protein
MSLLNNLCLLLKCLKFQVRIGNSIIVIIFVSRVFPSSFGAGLAVTPNTIDFSSVFQNGAAKLLENIHVFMTMIVFILAYFALLPLALRFDRVDVINVSIYCTISY